MHYPCIGVNLVALAADRGFVAPLDDNHLPARHHLHQLTNGKHGIEIYNQ